MCGTNQSKPGDLAEAEEEKFFDDYRLVSTKILRDQKIVKNSFYDNGFRLFNTILPVDEKGQEIQLETYFPKWGEYMIDLVPKIDSTVGGKRILLFYDFKLTSKN